MSNVLLTNEILVMRKIVENVLPHPKVIDLYNVYEDENRVHLVLELCSGGQLFDRIVKQERYSEAGAAAVVRQIAQGLAALHSSKIVHWDLKPENCLFLNNTNDSPLKIMDFGLSSAEFTDPVVGLFGSIDSPEALPQGQVTSKSKMWALWCYLICPALRGEFSLYEKTWKGISLSAKQLTWDLLKVGPDKRPSAQEMYDTDRSGCISKKVASMLRALPDHCLPADVTEPGKLDEIFYRMDANSDGKVTFDEFKAAM